MGRELRRVPLDFDWPIDETWEGFLNPLYVAKKCAACDGTGLSPAGKRCRDLWYGYAPFKPEDRGSTPFLPKDEAVLAIATRNVTRSPEYYGTHADAIPNEAARLCQHFNKGWSRHLNDDDVAVLVKAGRLMDFTHTWSPENGWQPKDPLYIPTAREVNIWSISGMGHDSINQWKCAEAECERLGEPYECSACAGAGDIWPSAEAEKAYEDWQPTPPPAGVGYQIWETVSEGSPISPVFATPEALAKHMAGTRWGADDGTPYETWLKFINGPGWAPSMVGTAAGLLSGVEAAAAMVGETR